MATKEKEIDNLKQGIGCLGKSAPDEPLFILVARDQLAAELVREWADRAEAAGTPVEKVGEAYALADAMDDWRATHGGGKIPD